MGSINFLSEKKEEREKGGKKENRNEIEWTNPSRKTADSANKISGKQKSGWLRFLKNDKKSPVLNSGGEDHLDKFLDREKIKKSREEILKLIKEGGQPENDKLKAKKYRSFFWLRSLLGRRKNPIRNFDEPSDHAEIIQNHNSVAEQRRVITNGAKSGKKIKDDKKEEKSEPMATLGENKEKDERDIFIMPKNKPLPAKDSPRDKEKKESWLDKIIGYWRAFSANHIKKASLVDDLRPPATTDFFTFDFVRRFLFNGVKRKKPILKKESPSLNQKSSEVKVEKSGYKKQNGEKEKKAEIKNEIKNNEPKMQEGGEWERSEILETNLIKGEIASFFNWKRGLIFLFIYIFSSCLTIAAIYEGLIFWGEKKKSNEILISDKIENLNLEIKPLEDNVKKIVDTQKKIVAAAGILKDHIYWTNFFKFLEDNTLADVYYLGGFSGDNKGDYSFSASTKDFRTILEQVNLLRPNKYVIDTSVNGGSVSPPKIESEDGEPKSGDITGGVDFTLKLKIDPELFRK